MKNVSRAKHLLTEAQLRCTPGRAAILEVLLATAKPVTRKDIAARIGKTRLDKVTIYRALDRFVEVGLVHKAYMDKRAWHYELAHNCSQSQCHPHFMCTGCGQTHCLVEVSPPVVSDMKNGFVVHRQQVRLEGLCPQCA
jgi:Fur family ferric uptake transcriptional regulator